MNFQLGESRGLLLQQEAAAEVGFGLEEGLLELYDLIPATVLEWEILPDVDPLRMRKKLTPVSVN